MAKSVVHYMSFLRGWIVKEWQRRLTASYYKSHQPAGASYTSDQCMQTIIKELWKISIHIWKEWNNTKLHGTDNAISLEQLHKETTTEAALWVKYHQQTALYCITQVKRRDKCGCKNI
jgi:predicted neuraminidase